MTHHDEHDGPAEDPAGDPTADPAGVLVATLGRTVPEWLERCVVRTVERQWGACPDDLGARARAMAARVAPGVVGEVRALVDLDVDEQRSTPLTILRAAVAHPTAMLDDAGVEPVARDAFVAERFPDDRYDLSPAGWADVHPDLHDPGLVWGAWKASVVLRRRKSP